MCDLHPNCPTVTMLERANVPPSADQGAALPPGFMTLSEEEYRKTVRQCPIERYYEVAEVPISMGQWSSVFWCQLRSTGARFAAKFCNKLRMGVPALAEIVHEVAALRHCHRCPRIVQLYEVFETDEQYVLVMELGSGGDLQGILDDNQVPYESDVIRFMRNLLEGLVFIHERNLAHLDIKPQNMVLTGEFPDCEVKLCDLEISRVITAGTEVREMLGTPDYVAPEILRFDPVCLTSDIWSVGVLAYVLLTGFTPFGGDTDSETFRNISRAELDFPDELFEDVSELAKDFIRRCLVKDPQGRLSARQSLMHPWLQQPEPVSRVPSVHSSSQSIFSDGFGSQDSVRTLRRSASKSREVLCEKVSHSHLKKNISKSRERLCDLKFGLSKSRERLARTVLAGGVSRSSEVLGNRPPWRAAGLNCPLGKPLPPPMERMGSFKVRDQYQSQVVAGLGSSQSINTAGQPFVRHCSLHGRKKSSPPAAEPADFSSSLRRNKKNMSRRNSLQMDSRAERDEDRQRETRRRSHSTRDEPEPCPRLERRRDSHGRRQLSAPPDDGKNMIIVEIISDDEQEDVFTRLYKDRLKDSELKWRKLRDSDYDDEKENKAANRSDTHLSVHRPRIERSWSRESARSRGSTKGGSDEALTERLNTQQSGSPRVRENNNKQTRPADPDTERENDRISAGSEQMTEAEALYGEEEENTISNSSESSEESSDEGRSSSESLQTQTPERETINSQTHAADSVSLESPQPHRDSSDSEMVGKDAVTPPEAFTSPEPAETQEPSPSEEPSTTSVKTMTPPRTSSTSPGRMDRVPESSAPWRRIESESPQRWRRPASSSPEPGMEPRRRRQGSTSAPVERSVNTDLLSTRDHGINTDSVQLAARDHGINTDSVQLAAVISPTSPRWERAETLPTPAVTTLRDVFERAQRADAPEAAPRQSSVPPTGVTTADTGLAKSPTEEDVRARSERLQRSERAGRVDADEKRSVAFVEADVPSRKSSAGCYRRCSSLSSDLGSSEMSSEAGSESYCVLTWEEAASGQVTELKPVFSTRSVGRSRSHSHQLAQLEQAKLRQRGRSHSVVSEPHSAAQPWGSLCSGSVARAFEKFHSMAGDSRKRRQSSPNIVGLGAKVADMGEV